MAAPEEIRANVEAGTQFHGANLWVLLFAILVASVGLNVNSTAVIIGALLISPLMGPIVRIGYGAALIKVDLIRRGVKNLLIAATVSLGASTALRTNVLEDLRSRNQQAYSDYEARFAQLQQQLAAQREASPALPKATLLLPEATASLPGVQQLGLHTLVRTATDSLPPDTVVVVLTRYRAPAPEQRRFEQWLRARLAPRAVQWLNEPPARR